MTWRPQRYKPFDTLPPSRSGEEWRERGQALMAQLSDDCFAFGGPLMAVDDAVAIITAKVTAIGENEQVSLADADGRILARGVPAPLPLPPFTNSAVDGYAVRGEDVP